MFFDKNYIELICSPYILIDEHGLRYEFEERAAILQYDGGLSREEADKRAFSEILERVKSGDYRNNY